MGKEQKERKRFHTTINQDLLSKLRSVYPNKPLNEILEEMITKVIEETKTEEVKPVIVPYKVYQRIKDLMQYRKEVYEEDLLSWFGNEAENAKKFLLVRKILEPFKDYTSEAYKRTKDPTFAEVKYIVNMEKLETLMNEQYMNNKKNLSEDQLRLLNTLLNYEWNAIKLTNEEDIQFLLANRLIKLIPNISKYNIYHIDKDAIKEFLYS